MSIVSELFTEKLRPQSLEQALLVDRVRNQLQNELNSPNGIVSNLLFFGTQGGGKTTLSRIMAQGHDTKVINCSGVGIDAVREDIQNFASQYSLSTPEKEMKIVLLEECDGFTADAWKAMRATVEKYSNNIRFIANCNYIEKIPDPIRSRFTCIQLEPLNEEEKKQLVTLYYQRCAKLLGSLGISFTEDVLLNFIMDTFPDFRSVLNKIQQIYISGVKELSASAVASAFDFSKLFDLIVRPQDPIATYKLIREEYSTNVDECIVQIGTKFPDYLEKNCPQLLSYLPKIIVVTAQHQDMLVRAVNRNLVLQSLIFNIQTAINS